MKTFKNFAEYWKAARHLTQVERQVYLKSLSPAQQRKLRKDYTDSGWAYFFEDAYYMKGLDDYYEWAEGKSQADRVRLLSVMEQTKKRELIKECSQRRRMRKEMKTPKYEFRFQNGDVFFSDKRDLQLTTVANVVVDHEKRTVEKNRYGQSGHQAYNQLFPEIVDRLSDDQKKIKDINDLEAVKAELDHWTPMETHLPIPTRITNIVNNYQSLASLYANLQKAYRELEAK